MKKADKAPEVKLSQFDFIITPTEIQFEKTQAQSYAFQICKGAQVYKKFSEVIWVHAEERSFVLVNKQSVEFKLYNEKGLNVECSIYKITDDELKEYFQSVTICLEDFYQSFVGDLKKGNKIGAIMANHEEGKSIYYEWNALKSQCKGQVQCTVKNKTGITLNYTVKIKHKLDYIAEEQHNIQMFKSQSKSSSKMLHEGSRSFLEEQVVSPRIHVVEQSFSGPSVPPVIIHAPIKRNEALSDILQSSNECSSMNPGDKGLKVHPYIEQIPEERQEHSPTLRNLQTHHFDSKNNELDDSHFSKKSKTLKENSDSSFVSAKQYQDDIETAAPSGISAPSFISKPKGSQSSLVQKAILLLIVVAVLSTLYYFDYKEVKSQGVLTFMKNMALDRKTAKAQKKGSRTENIVNSRSKNKGQAKRSNSYNDDDDSFIASSRKGKVNQRNIMSKDGSSGGKSKQKKVNLFSTVASWIFSSESNFFGGSGKDSTKQSKDSSWLSYLWRFVTVSRKKGGKMKL